MRRPQRWLLPASVIPTAAISLYSSYVQPDVSVRIIGISFIAVAQYGLLVQSALGPIAAADPHAAPRSLCPLCRLRRHQSLSCLGSPPAQSDEACLSSAQISNFAFLTPILIGVMTALGVIWLAMAQLQHELEAQSQTDSLDRPAQSACTRRDRHSSHRSRPPAQRPLSRSSSSISTTSKPSTTSTATTEEMPSCNTPRDASGPIFAKPITSPASVAKSLSPSCPAQPTPKQPRSPKNYATASPRSTVEHLSQEIRLSASFGVATMLPTDTTWLGDPPPRRPRSLPRQRAGPRPRSRSLIHRPNRKASAISGGFSLLETKTAIRA